MIVQKHIEKKVLRDYFFIEGTIDIDVSYFIKKIKEGFESGENRSHVTNVKGEMTNWLWFNKDPKFLEILNQLVSYIDSEIDLPEYHLFNSWGLGLKKNEKISFLEKEPKDPTTAYMDQFEIDKTINNLKRTRYTKNSSKRTNFRNAGDRDG